MLNIVQAAPEGSLIVIDFPTFPLVELFFEIYKELNLSTDKYRIILFHLTLTQLLARIPNLNNHYFISKYSIFDNSEENRNFVKRANEYFHGETLIGDYVFYVYNIILIIIYIIVIHMLVY